MENSRKKKLHPLNPIPNPGEKKTKKKRNRHNVPQKFPHVPTKNHPSGPGPRRQLKQEGSSPKNSRENNLAHKAKNNQNLHHKKKKKKTKKRAGITQKTDIPQQVERKKGKKNPKSKIKKKEKNEKNRNKECPIKKIKKKRKKKKKKEELKGKIRNKIKKKGK